MCSHPPAPPCSSGDVGWRWDGVGICALDPRSDPGAGFF